jgi:hypothetical protein
MTAQLADEPPGLPSCPAQGSEDGFVPFGKMRNTGGQSTKDETGRGVFWPPSGGVDKFF